MLRKYASCLCKVSSQLEERESSLEVFILCYCAVFIPGLAGWGIFTLKRPRHPQPPLTCSESLCLSNIITSWCGGVSTKSDSTAVDKYSFLHLQKIKCVLLHEDINLSKLSRERFKVSSGPFYIFQEKNKNIRSSPSEKHILPLSDFIAFQIVTNLGVN